MILVTGTQESPIKRDGYQSKGITDSWGETGKLLPSGGLSAKSGTSSLQLISSCRASALRVVGGAGTWGAEGKPLGLEGCLILCTTRWGNHIRMKGAASFLRVS